MALITFYRIEVNPVNGDGTVKKNQTDSTSGCEITVQNTQFKCSQRSLCAISAMDGANHAAEHSVISCLEHNG
jgi:hypothetical protein